MAYSNLTGEADQTYAEAANATEDATLKETAKFEEILAESFFEGLSWFNSTLAPVLDTHIRGASTVEIGVRKTRLNIRECEDLEKGLERVFGSGAKIVESKILKILNSKLRVSREIEPNFNFSDEVKKARKEYKSKRLVQNVH
jgi:hypothetical protein